MSKAKYEKQIEIAEENIKKLEAQIEALPAEEQATMTNVAAELDAKIAEIQADAANRITNLKMEAAAVKGRFEQKRVDLEGTLAGWKEFLEES